MDQRTRRHSEVRDLSAHVVSSALLPEMLERHGELAARGLSSLGAPQLSIAVGDKLFTLASDGGVLTLYD